MTYRTSGLFVWMMVVEKRNRELRREREGMSKVREKKKKKRRSAYRRCFIKLMSNQKTGTK
ncbi:hypothetical protein F2Q69_00034119 [Brassica cretica]|uniref:Uncharacterized protein n=1 Tax=Brassica cretica TaxID=69181 RepID=A0A8S9SNT9_BRACR|nr:hypothetical protein F2Q69_00034119 [Brassica cretica]